ncbi:MAG: insulinase family protein [Bdellovibrionaceae bacterium]|nr:insulinase family protein [Pseudobdellovibrionaceae bacterium]
MYKKFQLDNGMNVILVESHKSPVVSVQLWVKTGSADEVKGEEGLSHFIEHLVFKGTRKFKVGEIASIIEGSGGELNAYTSFDQTVFYVTISNKFTEVGLEAVSEMVGFPKFEAEEIDNEREVVLEEIKRGLDSPDRQASQLLFSTMYSKHPYGRPVIGYEKVVKNVSRKKILNYFHSRYVPTNMTLVVTGAFDKKTIKNDIKKYYSEFVDEKLEKRKREKEPKQEKPKIKIKTGAFKKNSMYLSWPIPKINHKDIPALELLALIFGQGDSSRLMGPLRIEKPLVHSVGSSLYTPLDKGFFTTSFSLNMENINEVLKILLEQFESLLSKHVSSEELFKAKIIMDSDDYYSLETVGGLAQKVGNYEHLFDDYKYSEKFKKQIHAVTAGEILSVARKYLKPQLISFVGMVSEQDAEVKKMIKKWIKNYEAMYVVAKKQKNNQEKSKQKQTKIKNYKTSLKEGAFKKLQLKCGASLVVKQDFETPLISFKAACLSGVRVEKIPGSIQLLSNIWATETKNLSELELYHTVDSMAAAISSFGGRNTIGLSMNCLNQFQKPMRDIFIDMLKAPVLSQDIIDRERHMLKEQLKRRSDNPAQMAVLQFTENLFQEHPYSIDLLGTEDSLDSINKKDLLDLYYNSVSTDNLNIVLTGAVNIEEWVKYLEHALKDIPKASDFRQKKFNFSLPQSKQLYTHSDKNQSHILLGYPGLTFKDDKRYTLSLIQAILSGQGGRLFLELRDKESLAYSVAPLRMEGIDAGYFATYIGCSPEKGKKAIKMLKEELKKLVTDKVSEEEILRAKRYLIGSHDIDLQKNSSVATSILFDDIYDVPFDETYKFAEKINSVTAKDVQALSKELFLQEEVISVVGSIKPW